MLLLHISDIHIKTGDESVLNRCEEIASCTFEYLPHISHVFIVVSGDIAYSGKEEEYQYAQMFLEDIRNVINKEKSSIKIDFIIAPGNHDCDFTKDNSVRQSVMKVIGDEFDKEQVETCTKIQDNFFQFCKTLGLGELYGHDKLFFSYTFKINDYAVAFDVINSSWLSQKNEEYGRLATYFPETKKAENIRILVMHHPPHWFKNYRDFRREIDHSIVITGHEHENNFGMTDDLGCVDTNVSILQ